MLSRAASLLLATAIAAPCAGSDGRIRTIFYDPQAIVTINARTSIETTVSFAADEHIENVAIGDSTGWQVTPNRRASLLFIKPQQARGRTNMTVVTDRRIYLFDLVAEPKAPAVYALQFSYPTPPPSPAEPIKPVLAAAAAEAGDPSPTRLNFRWVQRGSKRLMPDRVFDDGRSLFLSWNDQTPLPALLTVAPDGTEGPVNFSVRGAYIVIDGVPGRLVLRSGRETATLDQGMESEKARASRIAER